MLAKGIDTDNYDGRVSVARLVAARENHSIRFNIIGCEGSAAFPNVTAEQRDNSLAAGLKVPAAYKFLYWADNDLERMKWACQFGLPIYIDCEAQTDWQASRIIERIHRAKNLLMAEGLYKGIYTGLWWWPGHTNKCMDFIDDPLWHAEYPFNGGVLPPEDYVPPINRPLAYWGGHRPTVFQYADVSYGEPSFDTNYMELSTDMLIRENKTSNWYLDPAHQDFDSNGDWGLNVGIDYDMLPNSQLEVEIKLKPDSGPCEVLDGDGRYAFTATAGVTAHGTVIAKGDWIRFRGTGIKLLEANLLGYYG